MSSPITIELSSGEHLAAVLHGSFEPNIVVCSHGMFGNKDGRKYVLLAQLLAAQGLSMLRFDHSGCGESGGSSLELSFSQRREDLETVLEFCFRNGVQQVGLFGVSMGGATSLLCASRDERIVALATMSAVAHPEEMSERYPKVVRAIHQQGQVDSKIGPIGKLLFEDAPLHNVIGATRVLRAPVLVLHGDHDDEVPSADAHDIAVAARDSRLEIVLGADHRFSNEIYLRPALQQVASFMQEHLT